MAEQKEDNKKNTDSIVKVMDEVAMRTGRSENTLLTIFSDVRKMKNAIQRPTRNPDELEEARENSAYQNELLAVMQGIKDQLANNKKDEEKRRQEGRWWVQFLRSKTQGARGHCGYSCGCNRRLSQPNNDVVQTDRQCGQISRPDDEKDWWYRR